MIRALSYVVMFLYCLLLFLPQFVTIAFSCYLRLIFAVLIILGCVSCQSITLDQKYHPLEYIVKRPKLPMVDSSTCITIGNSVFAEKLVLFSNTILIHEHIHACRQEQFGLEAWLVMYIFDIRFRRDEELMAHKVDILMSHKSMSTFDIDYYATSLAEKYFGMISFEEAKQWIQSIDKNPGEILVPCCYKNINSFF